MKYIPLIQGSQDWLSYRNNKLGGSDASSCMGIGFMTPYQLYMNKLGLFDVSLNKAMREGQRLEPEARQYFIDNFGTYIKPAVVESETHPFMCASLDGIDEAESFIVEIKTGGQKDLEIAKSGKIPNKHFAQIQHNLHVTGLDRCIYLFYDGLKGYAIEVYRDTQYIAKLVAAEKKFWDGVLTFSPPPFTDKDYVEKSGEWEELAGELLLLMERMDSDEKRHKLIKARLIELADDHSCKGGGIKMSRIPRQGNVNYSEIPELKAIDLNQYRKEPIITWRCTKS